MNGTRAAAKGGAWSLRHGASWLTPQGEVLPIPGFHEEWLLEHEDLARGARNVCELILRERWISVTLFDGGYLELMVPDRRSEEVRRSIFQLLSRNASDWTRALVMAMDEEGYAMLEPGDAADEARLGERLLRPI